MKMEQILACLLAEMDAIQENMEAKTYANHEKVMMVLKASQEEIEAIMEACLEMTEATDLEANSKEIEFESEHQEAPKEEAAVETIRALED
jgi:hypothetical protein